jgi:hypothetical protein
MSKTKPGPKPKPRSAWRVWAKALGEKASPCDRESDRVATIRSLIFASYLITNLFIVAGVIRQWPNGGQGLGPGPGPVRSENCHMAPPPLPHP